MLPPHAALAGIIADSPYARLDEMIRMLIMQILVEQTSGWRGPTRVVRSLLPALSRLLVLGGRRLLFYVRYRSALVARPDRAIGRSPVKRTGRTSAILSPPILLIHAKHNPFIALHHAHRLITGAHAAGRALHGYYTPCAIHCGSYG